MTKREYLKSTPRDVRYRIEVYNDRLEQKARFIETHAWMSGLYVLRALGCAFGKGSYPDSPMMEEKNNLSDIAKKTGRSEEELNSEMIMYTMRIMQANAEIQTITEGRG